MKKNTAYLGMAAAIMSGAMMHIDKNPGKINVFDDREDVEDLSSKKVRVKSVQHPRQMTNEEREYYSIHKNLNGFK